MVGVTEGDKIHFQPSSGGTFPTGEKARSAEVEGITGDEIIVRQSDDGFTRRISEEQIV